MIGYTLPALVSVVLVCAWELLIARTGIFRTAQYWITMAIVFTFQVPVDGWLTKLDSPIIVYSSAHITGIRFPWDIPIEDFMFAFSLVTAVLLRWQRMTEKRIRV